MAKWRWGKGIEWLGERGGDTHRQREKEERSVKRNALIPGIRIIYMINQRWGRALLVTHY